MKQFALSLVMISLVKAMPAPEQTPKQQEMQTVICQFKGNSYPIAVPEKLLGSKDKIRSFCRGWLKAGGEIK